MKTEPDWEDAEDGRILLERLAKGKGKTVNFKQFQTAGRPGAGRPRAAARLLSRRDGNVLKSIVETLTPASGSWQD